MTKKTEEVPLVYYEEDQARWPETGESVGEVQKLKSIYRWQEWIGSGGVLLTVGGLLLDITNPGGTVEWEWSRLNGGWVALLVLDLIITARASGRGEEVRREIKEIKDDH